MKFTRFFLLTVLSCGAVQISFAQDDVPSRKLGLTASLQSYHFAIQMPVWAGQRITIAPSVSIVTATDAGMDLGFGIVPRFYLKDPIRFAPYISPKAGIQLYKPKEGDSALDIVAGIGFGGEYFFDTHFSMGVEGQANVSKSDKKSGRFGNPGGTNFNTAAAVHANVYF